MRLKIGSRKSDLARLQAQHVGRLLTQAHPGRIEIEYDFRESLGDKNLSDPLWKAPEKGLFTSDLAESLENQSVDLVVHSWKDMPIEISPLRRVVGTTRRADPRDLLLIKKSCLERVRLKKKLEIFSSSPRREYCLTRFLSELWPHDLSAVNVTSVRGNIPTRLKKLMETSEIDGLAVAKAALDRLIGSSADEFQSVSEQLQAWIRDCVWMALPLSTFPTAPAQGALAIEILSVRLDIETLLAPIIDFPETERVIKEREVLKSYGGGCHQKIGCSVIPSRSGVPVQFLIGCTDQGEKLFKQGILEKKPFQGKVWSTKAWDQFKNRTEIATADLAQDLVLVSKAEALPKNWKPKSQQVVWTAGIQTWKKLARQGLWVNGSADGLGLGPPPLDFLAGNLKSSVVVTHQRFDLPSTAVATYSVSWATKPERPNLEPGQAIYVRSRMDFELALELGLFEEPRIVYCGLGETFLYLEKQKHLFQDLRSVLSEEDV